MGKIIASLLITLVVASLAASIQLGMATVIPPGYSKWRSGVTHPSGVCGTFVKPSPTSAVVGSYATQAKRCLVADTGVWVELEDGTYLPAAWLHPGPCVVNWLWFPVPDRVP